MYSSEYWKLLKGVLGPILVKTKSSSIFFFFFNKYQCDVKVGRQRQKIQKYFVKNELLLLLLYFTILNSLNGT